MTTATFKKRLATAAMAAMALVGGVTASTTVATAAPANNLVTFGDSYARMPQKSHIPELMGKAIGANVRDFATPGATARSLNHSSAKSQVDAALRAGALNKGTTHVAMIIGGNDVAGFGGTTSKVLHPILNSTLGPQVARIKSAAPNAKISLIGYPRITSANGDICAISVGGQPIKMSSHLNYIHNAEMDINHAQRAFARQHGIQFIDLKPASTGHDMCAPLSTRYVDALLPLGPDAVNMAPIHPSPLGQHFIANEYARQVR